MKLDDNTGIWEPEISRKERKRRKGLRKISSDSRRINRPGKSRKPPVPKPGKKRFP